ncbi:poly-gamma-glutamate system protein [bacterium]|nr:poly-gamma-glutamate system protein [bacterium]
MKWHSRRVNLGALVFLALIGIAIMAIVELSKVRVKKPYFEEKVEASNLTQIAFLTINNTGGDCVVIDSVVDRNGTGLIGEQFTLITTDRGNLTSKLTTTNPNWGAVVVDMLREVGVDAGDYVAVAYTGSMPALNIAVITAVQTIGAIPVIVSSVGASMWGANNPNFAWLDMENTLFDKGVFKYKSIAASLGGRGDIGGNVSPEGRRILREIIERNSIPFINAATLDESIDKRVQIYEEALPQEKRYSAYVNVGGGLGSIGSGQNLVALRSGINMRVPVGNYSRKGAMIKFGEKGIPMIVLSDINNIAARYGLPIAPEPLPDIPHGDVYSELKYRLWLVIVGLVFYLSLVFVIVRVDLKGIIFRRKR